MSNVLSQVSYPVFLACVFIFFILISAFSFIVGIGLAMRSPTMLRFFDFMNRGFSVRRLIKPLFVPHFIEPAAFRHLTLLGIGIMLGAATSMFLLWDVNADVFQPVFLDPFTNETAEILASHTKSFLLVGNSICVAVGLLALFFPRMLSKIEAYADKWYTLRKQMRHLNEMHPDIDNWVLAHPTVSGVALSILSLVVGASMYARI